MDFIKLSPALAEGLGELFERFSEHPENTKFFTPHPFTREEAVRLCSLDTKDFYCVLKSDNSHCVAYGFLRGWDEGYKILSLGLAIRPAFEGIGLGHRTVSYLHHTARGLGAEQVRLRVHVENRRALSLYTRMGYNFSGETDRGQMVGTFKLPSFNSSEY